MAIKILIFIWHLPRNVICRLIKFYQYTLSKDHGPSKKNYPFGYCRFSPTCSEYCYETIKKHGFFFGGIKSIWRLARCNPFSKGGYDPP